MSGGGGQGGGGSEGDPLAHVGPEPASGWLDRDGEQGLEHRALRAQTQPAPRGGHVGGADQRGKRGGVRLVASITVEAVRQLGLKECSEVSAVIKASDVILATSD
jgi:hypothetical protein